MCAITGRSSTGTIGLVISYVSGRSRVPRPAARTIALIASARYGSVAVVVGLVGAVHRHADVGGLLVASASSASRRARRGAAARPSRRGAWAARRRAARTRSFLVNSSIWAIVWLVNELLITKLGCPVALPRFSRRPSESRMIAWPSGNTHSSTCGLMLTRSIPGTRARPAMSISLSKCPMLPTIAWCFIRAMWSAVMMSLLPVAVTKMSALSMTSSQRLDLVALHRRLQRADRVDLGDHHARALPAQRLRAALADVAEAADHGDLAADHHVGRAVDAVDQASAGSRTGCRTSTSSPSR